VETRNVLAVSLVYRKVVCMCNKKIEYADLIGVPFLNQGRDIKNGLDCYGLVKEVFARCDKEIGEYWCDAYNKEYINKVLRQAVSTTSWKEIDYQNGEPIPVPALVALRFNSPPGIVNHTAVYIGNGLMIHTRERIGVCVDRIDSPMWRKQIVGIYEFVR